MPRLGTTTDLQLYTLARKLKIPLYQVQMRDQIRIPPDKHGIIINLQPSSMSGSHWVAAYRSGNTLLYCDSFGGPPLQGVIDSCRKQKVHLVFSRTDQQRWNSTSCGYWSLFFLFVLSQGTGTAMQNFQTFHNQFDGKTIDMCEQILHNFFSYYM